MKKITKAGAAKEKVCKRCSLKNKCGDLPGFCVLIFYVPIALIVVMLIYFLMTSDL
jgi:hypothetical protein